MTELKPCPFCGCNASLVRGVRDSYYEICYIRCDCCDAIGEKFSDKFFDIAKEKAINAWNNRVKCGEG